MHWPISPSSCKFSFAEHSITVLYAKPVKLIKEHINFLYFTTSFNMIPTMVLKQVLDKFCMSKIFPELKNLKLLKCIIQSSSFIHLCKRQISLASVGQILFGLEKKSLMVKSVLLTCPNLFNYKLLNLLLSMIFSLLKFEIHNFGLDATPNIIRNKSFLFIWKTLSVQLLKAFWLVVDHHLFLPHCSRMQLWCSCVQEAFCNLFVIPSLLIHYLLQKLLVLPFWWNFLPIIILALTA